MRRATLLLVLFLLVPVAAAGSTVRGSGVGLDLGFIAPGTWDVYHFMTTGGGEALSLTWGASVFPFADYDLRIYRPGTLADNTLTDSELVAQSSNRGGAFEQITIALPAAHYYAAVAPYQAQNEPYTLTSAAGTLSLATNTVGFQSES